MLEVILIAAESWEKLTASQAEAIVIAIFYLSLLTAFYTYMRMR